MKGKWKIGDLTIAFKYKEKGTKLSFKKHYKKSGGLRLEIAAIRGKHGMYCDACKRNVEQPRDLHAYPYKDGWRFLCPDCDSRIVEKYFSEVDKCNSCIMEKYSSEVEKCDSAD